MAISHIPFLRRIASLIPITVIGVWMVLHWPLIASGGRELLTANRCWLLAVTGLGWVAVSARQGTVLEPLPAGRLFATQFAAGTAHHLLPTGFGTGAGNLRFLKRCGIPLTRSSAALALYLLAEAAGRVLLLLLTACPDALRLDGLVPNRAVLPLAWTAGGLVCTAMLARRRRGAGRRRRFRGLELPDHHGVVVSGPRGAGYSAPWCARRWSEPGRATV